MDILLSRGVINERRGQPLLRGSDKHVVTRLEDGFLEARCTARGRIEDSAECAIGGVYGGTDRS